MEDEELENEEKETQNGIKKILKEGVESDGRKGQRKEVEM